MLPGALMRNASLKFVCRDVFLRVENSNTLFTSGYTNSQVIRIPIAHHDGNYTADSETLKKITDNGQVAFRYCDELGIVSLDSNPNGSLENIAGITNDKKTVLGMMPHPERHIESLQGGDDGKALFDGLLKSFLAIKT